MKAFFDTSAFVKRYIEEKGSERVVEICGEAEHLTLSIICLPEMIATLNRLVRERKLSAEHYRTVKTLILDDFEDVEICEITPEVIRQTIGCLESSQLRAMDALHLGCALAVSPDLFVSSDRRQVEAARMLGLKVEEV